MLSALSRMFQAGPDNEPDRNELGRPFGKSKQRADALGLGIDISVLERKPSSTLSVAGMDRVRPPGPSHVSWKSPSSQASPASITHSASSPSLPFAPGSARPSSDVHRSSSLRRKSSQSSVASPDALAVLDTEGSNRGSTGPADLPAAKQLSPIDERVYFPPRRRPSLDSLPPTPDSTRVYDGHSTAAHPTGFLTRPLNRTISQTSTSTLRSTASAVPSIPPLDLRPNFQSTLGAAVPRKSRLAPPSLPTVLGSPPRAAKYSVIYEDGASARTASFITAPSVHTPEPDDAEPLGSVYAPSTGGTDTDTPGMLPAGLYPPAGRAASLRTFSTGLVDSDAETEAYIHQRWLKGVSFGSERLATPPAPHGPRATSACVLFWLGFVGPWCWLIGGWLLSPGGEIKPEGEDMALPVWIKRKVRGRLVGTDKEKANGEGECPPAKVKKHGHRLWFPLIAPSVETLSPVRSRSSVDSVLKRKEGQVDPWVVRCRVAAIASGVIILVAFTVAIIVVAGV